MEMDSYADDEDFYSEFGAEDVAELEYEDLVDEEGTSMKQMYEECMEPTLFSASDQIAILFISCLLYKISTQLIPTPRITCHVISFLCGLLGLYSIIGINATYTAVIGVLTYFCPLACIKKTFGNRSYGIVMTILLFYLVTREYFDVVSESWEQVRGVQMIMILKTLSVCCDVSSNVRKNVPGLLEYLGYIFCPATVVFGPWMSLDHYNRVYERRAWSFGWIVKVFATSTFGFLCLSISSCWAYWLFLGMNSRWIEAVQDALSVRFSHYFIAIISEATSVLSGFYSADGSMNVEVCKPWKIEFPRSLVEVVVYWNMPMHKWLKLHVYRPLYHLPSFWPLLLTFLVSSMLHGLNFNLTMVLLSLGFYTYVEHSIRDKLSSIFSACVRSRACNVNCGHSYTSDHIIVRVVNILFRIWAYSHLSYLGIMMDKSQQKSEATNLTAHFSSQLKRWKALSYASHWAVLILYVMSSVV